MEFEKNKQAKAQLQNKWKFFAWYLFAFFYLFCSFTCLLQSCFHFSVSPSVLKQSQTRLNNLNIFIQRFYSLQVYMFFAHVISSSNTSETGSTFSTEMVQHNVNFRIFLYQCWSQIPSESLL